MKRSIRALLFFGVTLSLAVFAGADPPLEHRNLGLAGNFMKMTENLLPFRVSEKQQGMDLDGNGIFFGSVTHIFDFRTGITTNLETISHPLIDGDLVFFSSDGTLATFDSQTGIVTRTKLPIREIVEVKNSRALVSERRGFFQPYEAFHLYDHRTRNLTELGIGQRARLGDDHLVITVPEAKRRDLNGDGDQDDFVAFVLNLNTGARTNTGLDVFENKIELRGTLATLRMSELEQALDLNGDSDLDDLVLFLLDLQSGTTRNTGLASAFDQNPILSPSRTVLVAVPEAGQGDLDLNGDGDRSDIILHSVDASGRVVNLQAKHFLGMPRQPDSPCLREDAAAHQVRSEPALTGRSLWRRQRGNRAGLYSGFLYAKRRLFSADPTDVASGPERRGSWESSRIQRLERDYPDRSGRLGGLFFSR